MGCARQQESMLKDGRHNSVDALFVADGVSLRERLREASERLLFLNPLEYGRRAEDAIWQHCFYRPIQLLRANRQAGSLLPSFLPLFLPPTYVQSDQSASIST